MARLLDNIVTVNYSHFLTTAKNAIGKRPINKYDVVHDVIEHLYSRDNNYINAIIDRGKIVPYIDRAIRLSIYSQRSIFYAKFLKFGAITCEFNASVEISQQDYNKLIARENLDSLIQQLPTSERYAIELYLLGYSYNDIATGTGIPLTYLYRLVKNAKKKITTKI